VAISDPFIDSVGSIPGFKCRTCGRIYSCNSNYVSPLCPVCGINTKEV